MLETEQQAPDFTLNDQDGKPVSLSDFKGKKVVLYFYPRDNTPGCIKEACSFRDNLPALADRGVVVLGISVDDEQSHQKFISKQNLNFTLLADTDRQVVETYGVWGEKSMYGRKYTGTFRKTFLIDETGRIVRIYNKVKVATHAADIIKDWNLV